MKTVFSNSELAHVWFHKSQAEGKSDHMFFEDQTIYSYGLHFPIAKHYDTDEGACVLFTTKGYSNTTAKHISYTRGAIPSGVPVFYVSEPTRKPDAVTMAEYKSRIDSALLSAIRSRTHADMYMEQARDLVKEATDCVRMFHLRCKAPVMPDMSVIEKRAKEQKELARKARIEKDKRDKEQFLKNMETWFSGNVPAFVDSAFQYCRIADDDIETTKGARVPVEHVKAALPLVLDILKKGLTYQRNGHSIHLGNYVIDSIDKDGILTAGCHRFQKLEVERIASLITA